MWNVVILVFFVCVCAYSVPHLSHCVSVQFEINTLILACLSHVRR